ncbi:MAG TPA: bifunctional diguanylate cyclase/phosphodiesterase [Baekduia sp.]|uniref:bifunctional diguanylate cyclase/phosphodiesterase n=1 Tax=Baekduia sp. TaxID=2600305 RepID=UPI002D799D2D|nr:bifunctional diguanylate cyclase/phosphodiesterase [Baekduia sp.]HET6510227.1 bifunctional diguanylate cyclase/phosphodiesterase [Baekduia sp.]
MPDHLRRRARGRLPFAARLALSLAIGLGVTVVCAYVLLHHRLRDEQIRGDARMVAADARTFERVGASASDHAEALREIAAILRAVRARPGVTEAMVIDADFRVVAAGDPETVGELDRDPAVEDAILEGRSYAGRESDVRADRSGLEYLEPLTLDGERFAYEITRTSSALDDQLRRADRTVLEVALLGLLAGALVFLPLGGTLVREHRRALQNATLDGLTHLPNARAFGSDLRAAVGRARRHGEQLTLVALDVDDFKFVNDRHGHRRGDTLLRDVATVLADGRAGDRAFRIGGDEFMVLLPRTAEAGAQAVCAKLLERLDAAGVRISAGLADLRPGDDHEALRQQSDAALYEAKRRGGHRVVTFDEIADETSVTSAEAALALRTLLDLGDAECVFQPIWDLRRGRLLGVEALARFPAGYGFEGPAEAFDVAQRIGRVHDLDVLCTREALRRAAPELPADALLFLNVAPQTLDREARGGDWLLAELRASGVGADRVVIEVTERVGARGAAVAAAIERLRAHGLRVAIDDVGSGTGGLEMLRRTHPDFVKVDRSVVAAADADAGARATLLAIAAFATQTGAYVIAEGVEDDAALELVRALSGTVRVDGAQGFGLGRPGPEMPATHTPPASTRALAA